MKAKKRQPAHFEITGRSSVFGSYSWKITVSETGIVAVRDKDRRRVSIEWKALIGAAMFYGHDSNGGAKRP